MSLVMPNGRPQPMDQAQFARDQISNAYQQYLGRPAENDQAIWSHLGGGRATDAQAIQNGVQSIMNSPEAQNYRNRPQDYAQDDGRIDPPGSQGQPEPPPNNSPGGGSSTPGVPATYQGSNLHSLVNGAMNGAPSINSQYQAMNIRDFTGRQLDIPSYTKTLFNQFSDPRNKQVQEGRDKLLLHAINNPESLSQQWQDQNYEAQKDQALSLASQLGLQNEQALAGRGIFGGDGQSRAAQQNLQSNLASQLLAGRRDIAQKAATQNFADRLNVLGASEAGLSGDTNRAAQIFAALLSGQQAQAGENQFAAKYGFDSTNALADNERQNYGSYLSGRSVQDQSNARAEQFRQSAFGLSQQARQAAAQNALNTFMAGNNADLGWANYGLGADQQFLNYLTAGF